MTRPALITTDTLRKMAKVVAEQGVTFHGRVDASGMSFTIAPAKAGAHKTEDDLDARLAAFGAS